jgi:hypothetical protein
VLELLKLASHQAHGYVVPMEGLTELSPRHLVAVVKSGGVDSPPSTGRPTKLPSCIQSLLELNAVQEAKLGLNDAKSVICLERISRLGERPRVCHQEVGVGGVHHHLVVWLVHSMMHEVIHQHTHELILRG